MAPNRAQAASRKLAIWFALTMTITSLWLIGSLMKGTFLRDDVSSALVSLAGIAWASGLVGMGVIYVFDRLRVARGPGKAPFALGPSETVLMAANTMYYLSLWRFKIAVGGRLMQLIDSNAIERRGCEERAFVRAKVPPSVGSAPKRI